jgi:hypothetical protein
MNDGIDGITTLGSIFHPFSPRELASLNAEEKAHQGFMEAIWRQLAVNTVKWRNHSTLLFMHPVLATVAVGKRASRSAAETALERYVKTGSWVGDMMKSSINIWPAPPNDIVPPAPSETWKPGFHPPTTHQLWQYWHSDFEPRVMGFVLAIWQQLSGSTQMRASVPIAHDPTPGAEKVVEAILGLYKQFGGWWAESANPDGRGRRLLVGTEPFDPSSRPSRRSVAAGRLRRHHAPEHMLGEMEGPRMVSQMHLVTAHTATS